MVDLEKSLEVPQVGLNLTADPLAFKPGEYSHMLNGCLFDLTGKAPFARMYMGNRRITGLPAGYYQIGSTNIAQKEVCLFLVNPSTGECEIGLFDGILYTTRVSHKDLGFVITHQIQAIAEEDFNGGKIVLWVDHNKNIRFMDLNNPPMLNGQLDVDALNIFRKYTYPQTAVTEITNNGRILAGAYYISLQYSDENGNGLTSCSTPIGPIFIYRDSITQPIDFVNGSPNREPTDKAIRIKLSNLDKSFKYVNVIVIKSYEGIRSSVVAATIPTFQESYLYTGIADTERDIDLKEVLTPAVSYASAKTIALVNGVALLGNLKGKTEFNFQPYISKIGLQWQLVKEKRETATNSYANPLKSLYELQFRRNEVYDLGLVIRWNDGTKSRVYPFVGRQKNKNSRGNVINNTVDQYNNTFTAGWDTSPMIVNEDLFETGIATPERWQKGNTAFVDGDDLPTPADVGPHLYGEFGYWESTDRYPNDSDIWGADAGQPIRKFRMPDHSIAPMIDGEGGFKAEQDPVYMFKLGIRFVNIEDIMATLPDEIKSDIAGWEIVRADRRQNKAVLGSGLLFNMWYQNWKETSILPFSNITTPGSGPDDVRLFPNYPLNDLHPDYYYKKQTIGTDVVSGTDVDQNDRYRKDVFTFVSPDTSFSKNLIFSGELLIHNEVYGISKSTARYLEPYPMLKNIGDDDTKSAYQTVSIGNYNNWKKGVPGNLRRKILNAMYLPFNSTVGGSTVSLPIHNLTRESSVLIHLAKDINNPTTDDTSRVHLTDPDFDCKLTAGVRFRIASAHYASIYSPIANQYGSIFDPRYIFTNYDNSNVKNNKPIFGGDSYICPFSVKRQLSVYQNAQAFMDFADGALGIDLKNSETIAHHRYFYEALRRKARADSSTECENGNDINKMPLIHTGIPVFYAESDYNVDLRINGEEPAATYYPNLNDGGIRIEEWAGIKNVDKDNDYSMNLSYNEQNDLYGYSNPDPFYKPLLQQQAHYSTRVIFSLQGNPENRFNNLLVYLPLNYHDFPRDSGELWNIQDLGNNKVMFQMQHAFYIDNIYTTLETDSNKLILGSGKLFESQPARISRSANGWSGSSEQWTGINTPFGAFATDALRGSAFIYGQTLNDIAANDVDAWMQSYMPFKLIEDIPAFKNTDNPANPEGIGFHSVYDAQNKLWLLTKRDYELIDKKKAGHFHTSEGKLFYNDGPVSLSNTTLFKDRSWTFAYSPTRQKWVGWMSFVPGSYFVLGNRYYSVSDNAIWCHDNKALPRTYYGKRYPFELEMAMATKGEQILQVASFVTRAFEIRDGVTQGESTDETFNKGEVSNSYQTTGLLNLTVQDENNLHTIIRDPVITAVSIEKFLRRVNHTWNVDELYDMVKDHKFPFRFPEWPYQVDHNNIDYKRDYKEAAQLRDFFFRLKLIYDREKDIQLNTYLYQGLTEISIK